MKHNLLFIAFAIAFGYSSYVMFEQLQTVEPTVYNMVLNNGGK